MSLKEQILRLLIENKEKDFSIREISIILKKDYKNVYESIKQLNKSLIINKKGNANYIKFRPILTKEIYEVEKKRTEIITKKIKIILKDIESIDNPFFIFIIFGSYTKNKEHKNSDIDICIIHDNDEELQKIFNKLSIHPKLELQSFHYSEFIRMIKTKDFNVCHEIFKDGIILKNIESYYYIIKNE